MLNLLLSITFQNSILHKVLHTQKKKSSTTGLVEGEEYQKIWNLFGV